MFLPKTKPHPGLKRQISPLLTPAACTSAQESRGHPSPCTPVLLQGVPWPWGGSGRSQLPAEVQHPPTSRAHPPSLPFSLPWALLTRRHKRVIARQHIPPNPLLSASGTKATNERERRKIKKPREVQAPAWDFAPLLQGRLGWEEQRGSCLGRRHHGHAGVSQHHPRCLVVVRESSKEPGA